MGGGVDLLSRPSFLNGIINKPRKFCLCNSRFASSPPERYRRTGRTRCPPPAWDSDSDGRRRPRDVRAEPRTPMGCRYDVGKRHCLVRCGVESCYCLVVIFVYKKGFILYKSYTGIHPSADSKSPRQKIPLCYSRVHTTWRVDQRRIQQQLNSLTPIGGHDHQLFDKLLWCLVSSPIFVRCQRLIARKIAELFSSNRAMSQFYEACGIDDVSTGSMLCLFAACFGIAIFTATTLVCVMKPMTRAAAGAIRCE